MTAIKTKETIYIDVDDEITAIIDKLKNTPAKIVALVLPKRATALQSVVNMKLLKKSAANAKKNIVLITSEAGLLPLAGAAGVHVAKSLQSKPLIPPAPDLVVDDDQSEVAAKMPDTTLDIEASIGTLAAAAAGHTADEEAETIDLDNTPTEAAVTAKKGMRERLKHLKVPNFDKFRLGFFLAILGVLLLVFGWYMAFVVMPKATIIITTDTTTAVSSFDFTATTAATELNIDDKIVPAVLKEVKKTDEEKAEATGEKNVGEKATGEVEIYNCSKNDKLSDTVRTVPSGTTVSINGLNFITTESGDVDPSSYSGDDCVKNKSAVVDVIAEKSGGTYNIDARKGYAIQGFSTMSGDGSNMGGGTDKMVKIVSQNDIDEALAKMKSRLDKEAEEELKGLFDAESLLALTETRVVTDPVTKSTPELDKEATEFTVTSETTYSMLGIKRDDLSAIIKKDVEADIDTERQSISDDGIDSSIMRLNNQPKPGEAFLSFRTSVTAGPEFDEVAIKEAVRGKKRGEVENYIAGQPGVKKVVVEYSPFWVYSTPKAAKKITIIIEKNDQSATTQQTNGSE